MVRTDYKTPQIMYQLDDTKRTHSAYKETNKLHNCIWILMVKLTFDFALWIMTWIEKHDLMMCHQTLSISFAGIYFSPMFVFWHVVLIKMQEVLVNCVGIHTLWDDLKDETQKQLKADCWQSCGKVISGAWQAYTGADVCIASTV